MFSISKAGVPGRMEEDGTVFVPRDKDTLKRVINRT